MRVGVIGTGYVGLATGTCLAEMGNDVVCVDNVQSKVQLLRQGGIPIYEPGLEEMVRRNLRDERLQFTTCVAEAVRNAEVCFVAVGTPQGNDGGADTSQVLAAAQAIAENASGYLVVAVKSTVPVGTCYRAQRLIDRALESRAVSFGIDVVSNPEFLKEGKAISDFVRPDRIVVGTETDRASAVMRSLYSHFIRNGHTYLRMAVRSSEMTKYAANAMLATRISLMNELSLVCDKVGADIMDVRKGVGSDTRIGMDFLYAGAGYGGSCFPKDVRALSRLAVESDCPANILDAVDRVNRHQKLVLAHRIVTQYGGDLTGRHFALWGVAFKPKTDDIREAPALTIIKRLTEAGATVCLHDPQALKNARETLGNQNGVHYCKDMYGALQGADALVLVTEWSMFRRPDFERIRGLLKEPVIFDGRSLYEPTEMHLHGFRYYCIGRAGVGIR